MNTDAVTHQHQLPLQLIQHYPMLFPNTPQWINQLSYYHFSSESNAWLGSHIPIINTITLKIVLKKNPFNTRTHPINSSPSQIAEKSLVGTLMNTLPTMEFDGSHTMHEHVIEITNIIARLKTLREWLWMRTSLFILF